CAARCRDCRTPVGGPGFSPVSGRCHRLSARARRRANAIAGEQHPRQSALERGNECHQFVQGPRWRLGDKRWSAIRPRRHQDRDAEAHQLGRFFLDTAYDGPLQKTQLHHPRGENAMTDKFSKKWIVILIVVVVGGVLGYKYWKSTQSALPVGIVSGNGRIEARLSDASAKEPLRVKEVLVDEDDLVRPGQVLVRLDTVTIDAELAKDEAAVASAREEFDASKAAIAAAYADIAAANADTAAANAAIEQQQSEIQLAQIEADRQGRMLAENATSQAMFDVRQTALETTTATLKSTQAKADAARARAGAAQARAGAAQSQADAAQQQIGVALAQVERTKSRIKDATLISPVTGRVLYRLVEPGEVLGAGGKALTLV